MNPEPDGTSRTVKAQYYKNSLANFIRGGIYGATAVIEIYEESDSDKYGRGRLQDDNDAAGKAGAGELPRADGARGLGLPDDEHNGSL